MKLSFYNEPNRNSIYCMTASLEGKVEKLLLVVKIPCRNYPFQESFHYGDFAFDRLRLLGGDSVLDGHVQLVLHATLFTES